MKKKLLVIKNVKTGRYWTGSYCGQYRTKDLALAKTYTQNQMKNVGLDKNERFVEIVIKEK